MQHLNLPAYDCKLKHSVEQTFIFDSVRRKFVILTPEEWVRQHVVNYLVQHLSYPKSLIAIERGTRYNQLAKRTDLCVYQISGKPFLLAECKAPDVPISDSVIKQTTTYNKTVGARFVLLTNGITHFCWEVDFSTGINKPLDGFPTYPDQV